ncbi:aminotransferase class IV [Hirschia litorea]|uniref:Probable branched-chain-amino-acid aminotransferase n=1 Tax=Hirschia litorea TaxID=1199156 RepID=A0ABW2IJG5_9PROT
MIDRIWMNGEWMDAGNAHISPQDRGFLLGDTCFETLRFGEGVIEGKAAHIKLLRKSMAVLEMQGGPDDADIYAALEEAEAALNKSGAIEASVRITFSRGQGRGAVVLGEPMLVIQMSKIEAGRPYAPLKLITSPIRRNETSPLTRIKAGCYGDHLAALRHAQKAGGNEALMLNMQGNVAGLAMGNIVVFKENGLITPPIEDGVRAGFMRQQVFKRMKDQGLQIEERSVRCSEIEQPEGVVCGLNSLWGVRPVISIDGRQMPNSSPAYEQFVLRA